MHLCDSNESLCWLLHTICPTRTLFPIRQMNTKTLSTFQIIFTILIFPRINNNDKYRLWTTYKDVWNHFMWDFPVQQLVLRLSVYKNLKFLFHVYLRSTEGSRVHRRQIFGPKCLTHSTCLGITTQTINNITNNL